MSRIGKKPIAIPKGVEVNLSGETLQVKGSKGTLAKEFRKDITIEVKDDTIILAPKRNDKFSRALWGTYASHISNMIEGVQNPYVKKLILEGVGFKSEVKPAGVDGVKELHLALGFSHPVVVDIPEGIEVEAQKNVITITGINKELVGSFSAQVRALKKPEPYKGKGFRYENEVIRRKQGKKTV